jgi:hypothetical protein
MDHFELLECSDYPGCWQTDIDFNGQDLPIAFIDDVYGFKGPTVIQGVVYKV